MSGFNGWIIVMIGWTPQLYTQAIPGVSGVLLFIYFLDSYTENISEFWFRFHKRWKGLHRLMQPLICKISWGVNRTWEWFPQFICCVWVHASMGIRLSRNERKHTAVAQLKLLDSICIWGVGNLVVLDFIFILACTLWNLYHFFIAGDCGADVPGQKGVWSRLTVRPLGCRLACRSRWTWCYFVVPLPRTGKALWVGAGPTSLAPHAVMPWPHCVSSLGLVWCLLTCSKTHLAPSIWSG